VLKSLWSQPILNTIRGRIGFKLGEAWKWAYFSAGITWRMSIPKLLYALLLIPKCSHSFVEKAEAKTHTSFHHCYDLPKVELLLLTIRANPARALLGVAARAELTRYPYFRRNPCSSKTLFLLALSILCESPRYHVMAANSTVFFSRLLGTFSSRFLPISGRKLVPMKLIYPSREKSTS